LAVSTAAPFNGQTHTVEPPAVARRPNAPDELYVRSLGVISVTRNGQALEPCTARKALSVFLYLLAQPNQTAHKDEIVEAFWPDAPARQGCHSLHVAIGTVRRYLDPAGEAGPSYLHFVANAYAIHPDAFVREDRIDFIALGEDGDRQWSAGDFAGARRAYANALALYAGDYRPDDADPTWAVAERERLIVRYLTMLDRLGHIAIKDGAHEQALGYFRLLVERDPYREDIHARILRCYAQLGRRVEAMRHFDRCTATLAADLGLQPSQELRSVYTDLF
jgi:DNA-binding SARP family transcriptional activator